MINLMAATQAEANPVIDAFKLVHHRATFSHYQNDEIQLVITGLGKCNTATACGWLGHKTFENPNDSSLLGSSVAWLNFGIAGHQTAELGTAFVAQKITDLATDRVWFPHRLPCSIATADITTVDKPLSRYLPKQLHDMEASAFIEAARKFSDAELVQAFKVVSDNEKNSLLEVNAKLASKLIADNMQSIDVVIKNLQKLCNVIEPADKTVSSEIQQRCHFTASQRVQLDRFIQRYNVLYTPLTTTPKPLLTHTSAKSILAWFKTTVNCADTTL